MADEKAINQMVKQTRVRNYTIDFLRVIAALLMTTFHWIWLVYFPGPIDNGYWGAYTWISQHVVPETPLGTWDWFKGTYTMGFFVFVTGYFMMASYKSLQRKGAFEDKRANFMHTWRFTAKTYCGYAPLMLFGTTWGWILSNAHARASIADWFNSFIWNIWSFLGVDGFGMFQNNATLYANGPAGYDGPMWYISAFIVFGCVFYAILLASERVAVFVVCPVLFAMSNFWLNQWLDPVTGAQLDIGITSLIPHDLIRLWGPLALGIWGWYIVNALQNAELTNKQEKALGLVWLGCLAYVLITSWTGYFGGMLNQDVMWMIVAGLGIALKDPITRGLNDKLQKFPLSKYFADFSAGLYLVHVPILANFAFDFIGVFGLQNASWFYELMCICGAFIYMLVNSLILKPVYGKLAQVLNARGPVVVDESTPRNFA